MPSKPRAGLPDIWCTHLSKILVGDDLCLLQPWLKAHFVLDKRPTDAGFDFAKWRIEHTELLALTYERYVQDGWTVTREGQNAFKLKGASAKVGGKPDLVARKDGHRPRVVDCKTGSERDSNSAQVAIYMHILPMVWGFPDLKLDGEVVYGVDRRVTITWEQAQVLCTRLFPLIRQIGSHVKPEAVPSQNECTWCDVQKADCPQRHGEGEQVEVLTSEF